MVRHADLCDTAIDIAGNGLAIYATVVCAGMSKRNLARDINGRQLEVCKAKFTRRFYECISKASSLGDSALCSVFRTGLVHLVPGSIIPWPRETGRKRPSGHGVSTLDI